MERERERGPDRGPRKRYGGKIAGSKAEKAVKKCLLNGGTLEEASRLVTRINGKSISKQSVSRYYHRLIEAAERTQMLDAFARALGEKLASRGAKGAQMARKMILARALEAAAGLTEDALAGLPPDRLASLVCRLERAEAEADQHRWNIHKHRRRDPARWEAESGEAADPPPVSPILDLIRRIRAPMQLEGERGGPEGAPQAPPAPEDQAG